MEFIVFGVIILLLLCLSALLLSGRGSFLIAGYNTMDKEKKAKFDEKALCRFVGMLLIVISICIVLMPIGIYFEMEWLIWLSSIAIIVLGILATIYANTGNRFLKK